MVFVSTYLALSLLSAPCLQEGKVVQIKAAVAAPAVVIGRPVVLRAAAGGAVLIDSFEVDVEGSVPSTFAAGSDQPSPGQVFLHTGEGQRLRGVLSAATDGQLAFDSVDFTDPLSIDPMALESIRFATEEGGDTDYSGKYSFLLKGGDALRGRIQEVHGQDSWLVDLDGMGPLSLSVSELAAVDALASEVMVYSGPFGLGGWDQRGTWLASGPSGFIPETSDPRSLLKRDFGLNGQRLVDIELQVGREAHFRMYLLGQSMKRVDKDCITLEIWGDTLVAYTEGKKRIFATPIPGAMREGGLIVLKIKTDADSLYFLDDEGVTLATLSRPDESGPGFGLECDAGSLKLSSIRVLNTESSLSPVRLIAQDVLGLDAEAGVYQTTAGEVPVAAVLGFDFPTSEVATPESEPDPGDQVRLIYSDGRRVTGEFVSYGEGELTIRPTWQGEARVCSTSSLEAITVVRSGTFQRKKTSRSFLVTGNGEIAGSLESVGEDGAITWKPTISASSATLSRDSVRRIVVNRTTSFFVSNKNYPHFLRLRSGDSFRCKVVVIGSEESRFATPFGGEVTISNDLIKAIEFDTRKMAEFAELFVEKVEDGNNFGWGNTGEAPRREVSEGFDAASLERALALPRKYKQRRFKHLVLARTGDFLRTNVIGWSEEGILYSSGLSDERLIPTRRLAAVVWLDDPILEDVELVEADLPSSHTRLILDEQTCLTVELSGADNEGIEAVSPILGELRVDLEHLLSIELSGAAALPPSMYSKWVFIPKEEPFPDAAQAGTGQLPVVGERAPAAIGKDLHGDDFNLASATGSVVLLDFWGFW